MKELYIFRHPTNPNCPVVMHFCLVNLNFRNFKAPAILRQTDEEKEFASFNLFDDPNSPYSTFNFKYTHEQFDRLKKLTEFNTLLHIEDIKDVMKECIEKRRNKTQKAPIPTNKMKTLKIKSLDQRRQLRNYLCRFESLHNNDNPVVGSHVMGADDSPIMINIIAPDDDNALPDDQIEEGKIGEASGISYPPKQAVFNFDEPAPEISIQHHSDTDTNTPFSLPTLSLQTSPSPGPLKLNLGKPGLTLPQGPKTPQMHTANPYLIVSAPRFTKRRGSAGLDDENEQFTTAAIDLDHTGAQDNPFFTFNAQEGLPDVKEELED
ncbi:unnamed protein product [Owenia fusiformis]|uniref:Uncharacterized protein n=1 Tax=Owenia fusiformis TaxID=6347 RepID=A0A8J1TNC8_OWEFU|nr:unnamed protein product [Owenia fusiformis]